MKLSVPSTSNTFYIITKYHRTSLTLTDRHYNQRIRSLKASEATDCSDSGWVRQHNPVTCWDSKTGPQNVRAIFRSGYGAANTDLDQQSGGADLPRNGRGSFAPSCYSFRVGR